MKSCSQVFSSIFRVPEKKPKIFAKQTKKRKNLETADEKTRSEIQARKKSLDVLKLSLCVDESDVQQRTKL